MDALWPGWTGEEGDCGPLRALPPGLLPALWPTASTATFTMQAALTQPTLLLRTGTATQPRLGLALRRRPLEQLDAWERLQNYGVFAEADGTVLVLDCCLQVDPPLELLRALEQGWRPGGEAPGLTQAWMRDGLVRLGAPLPAGRSRASCTVELRIGAARIDLLLDGCLVDSEWPCGVWSAGGQVLVGEAVRSITVGDADQSVVGEPLAAQGPALAQHWAPRGHNAWAGDTMWCAADGRLHLYWLYDRRTGASRWSCGASQFAHHSTSDLATWSEHPLAYPISKAHELSLGTGAVILHQGVFHLYSRHCQERLGPGFEALHPGGMHHAVSQDSLTFTKLGPCPVSGQGRTVHDLGSEPGMLRDAEGLWHAAAAGTRLTSSDLHHWLVADAEFLPPVGWPCTRQVASNECTCWFRWRGWHYVLSGRTGFWMSRALTGPYWGEGPQVARPAFDPYDGLMVPQAVVFNDRCLLAGWLALGDGFAGHLVFRELKQRPDGTLESRRLSELEPRTGAMRQWQVHQAAGITSGPQAVVIDARARPASARIPEVGVDVRIRMRLEPVGCARFGLRLLAGGAASPCCELRLEPARKRAQWGTSRDGAPAEDSERMPFWGHDFAILQVEHLDRPLTLDLLVRSDPKSSTVIIDAAIDQRRTMITRRREAGDQLMIWADSGVLTVGGLCIQELEDRIAR